MDLSLSGVQTALIGLPSRADRDKQERLLETFVDAQPLFKLLQSTNNQVIFGRRGTGKTHALKVLGDWAAHNNDVALFLDLRTIGSNGSIYTDQDLPFGERATRLLLDVAMTIHDELLSFATSDTARIKDGTRLYEGFQRLEAALSKVQVVGSTEVSASSTASSASTSRIGASVALDPGDLVANLGAEAGRSASREATVSARDTGLRRYHIQFPTIHDAIQEILFNLNVERAWLLLDEWSEIPSELQPYLADLLRRSVIPIAEVVIKIAAIEHRTNFIIHQDGGAYVGFEMGADVAADVNLDDFMVFDNDADRARSFFANLFFKHYVTTPNAAPQIDGPERLIGFLFTQARVFDELVRAAEGVPRDAIYLISKVAQRSFGNRITMDDVQQGARDWYQQDKYAVVRQDEALSQLLERIIEEVIGNRRSRAFLFRSGIRNRYLDRLFDGRLLHILKRGRSSHDEPGVRYDVYKLDYGCYVELLRTTKVPLGLFQIDDNTFVEVPPDDYRSVRRAILRPDDLNL